MAVAGGPVQRLTFQASPCRVLDWSPTGEEILYSSNAGQGIARAAFIEKYQKIYPTAVECFQHDLEAYLTFYSFLKEHWKTLRINNVIERLFGEVKRRPHTMAAALRNEGSRVLLFYAVIRSLKFSKLTMPAASLEQPGSTILHRT